MYFSYRCRWKKHNIETKIKKNTVGAPIIMTNTIITV